METGQLEAFVSAARKGSFTRAAEDLALTQPSVSARIAALEAGLGGPLFVRGRRLSLSPLGEAILPYAERALLAIREARQAARDLEAGKTGRISIVALNSLALYMLPDPLRRFRHEYPGVDFSIRVRIPRDALGEIYDGSFRLGLVGGPLWSRDIRILARFQEPVIAAAAAGHALTQKTGALQLADLFEHTIYRISLNPAVTAFVQSVVEQARPGSGGAVVWVPILMAIRLLLEGQGVAFLPRSFVGEHLQAGRLVQLTIPDMPRLTHEPLLICRAGQPLDALHAAFVQMVRTRWRDMLVDADPAE